MLCPKVLSLTPCCVSISNIRCKLRILDVIWGKRGGKGGDKRTEKRSQVIQTNPDSHLALLTEDSITQAKCSTKRSNQTATWMQWWSATGWCFPTKQLSYRDLYAWRDCVSHILKDLCSWYRLTTRRVVFILKLWNKKVIIIFYFS